MMEVIDFHSHVLPGIDDGSKNIETSMKMLQTSKASGVDRMIATPHFYADCDRIERFLERREQAYLSIADKLSDDTPKLLLGAEVAFFEGISQAEKIEALTIDDSNLMLLEMPFRTWRQSDIAEVKQLIYKRNFSLIIAHLERYMKKTENRKYISELMELPVTIQINAESLLDCKQSRTLLRMVKKGQIHVLGSDCHGMHHRPPNLMEGRQVIEKKAGADCLKRIDETGNRLLGR